MNYPADDQLIELFNSASAGLLVTDIDGRVILANRASKELLHDSQKLGMEILSILDFDDFSVIASRGEPVENRPVEFSDNEFSSGFANVGFGNINGHTYAFWALRPIVHSPLPSLEEASTTNNIKSAASWISRLEVPDSTYIPAATKDIALIRGIYDYCPVAIHLIEENGNVGFANWKDIAIVGASNDPSSYVGHHIRHIYADREVIDDFLGRWGEDSPIINFRADFLNNGNRVPVVIFSTANVVDGTLVNTRCFVFPDDQPDRKRDQINALDLAF